MKKFKLMALGLTGIILFSASMSFLINFEQEEVSGSQFSPFIKVKDGYFSYLDKKGYNFEFVCEINQILLIETKQIVDDNRIVIESNNSFGITTFIFEKLESGNVKFTIDHQGNLHRDYWFRISLIQENLHLIRDKHAYVWKSGYFDYSDMLQEDSFFIDKNKLSVKFDQVVDFFIDPLLSDEIILDPTSISAYDEYRGNGIENVSTLFWNAEEIADWNQVYSEPEFINPLDNHDFETGDLTGWNYSGSVAVSNAQIYNMNGTDPETLVDHVVNGQQYGMRYVGTGAEIWQNFTDDYGEQKVIRSEDIVELMLAWKFQSAGSLVKFTFTDDSVYTYDLYRKQISIGDWIIGHAVWENFTLNTEQTLPKGKILEEIRFDRNRASGYCYFDWINLTIKNPYYQLEKFSNSLLNNGDFERSLENSTFDPSIDDDFASWYSVSGSPFVDYSGYREILLNHDFELEEVAPKYWISAGDEGGMTPDYEHWDDWHVTDWYGQNVWFNASTNSGANGGSQAGQSNSIGIRGMAETYNSFFQDLWLNGNMVNSSEIFRIVIKHNLHGTGQLLAPQECTVMIDLMYNLSVGADDSDQWVFNNTVAGQWVIQYVNASDITQDQIAQVISISYEVENLPATYSGYVDWVSLLVKSADNLNPTNEYGNLSSLVTKALFLNPSDEVAQDLNVDTNLFNAIAFESKYAGVDSATENLIVTLVYSDGSNSTQTFSDVGDYDWNTYNFTNVLAGKIATAIHFKSNNSANITIIDNIEFQQILLSPFADYHFDEGSGSTAQDYVSGFTASGFTGNWVSGFNGSGVETLGLPSPKGFTIADRDEFTFSDGVNDTAFSIDLWVNVTGAAHIILEKTLLSAGGAPYDEYLLETTSAEAIRFYIYDGSSNYIQIMSNPSVLSVGTWNHILVTYNPSSTPYGSSTDISIYVNGTEVTNHSLDSDTGYTGVNNTAQVVDIGGDFDSGFGNGIWIDQLRFWNFSVSAAQTLQLYNLAPDLPTASILDESDLTDDFILTIIDNRNFNRKNYNPYIYDDVSESELQFRNQFLTGGEPIQAGVFTNNSFMGTSDSDTWIIEINLTFNPLSDYYQDYSFAGGFQFHIYDSSNNSLTYVDFIDNSTSSSVHQVGGSLFYNTSSTAGVRAEEPEFDTTGYNNTNQLLRIKKEGKGIFIWYPDSTSIGGFWNFMASVDDVFQVGSPTGMGISMFRFNNSRPLNYPFRDNTYRTLYNYDNGSDYAEDYSAYTPPTFSRDVYASPFFINSMNFTYGESPINDTSREFTGDWTGILVNGSSQIYYRLEYNTTRPTEVNEWLYHNHTFYYPHNYTFLNVTFGDGDIKTLQEEFTLQSFNSTHDQIIYEDTVNGSFTWYFLTGNAIAYFGINPQWQVNGTVTNQSLIQYDIQIANGSTGIENYPVNISVLWSDETLIYSELKSTGTDGWLNSSFTSQLEMLADNKFYIKATGLNSTFMGYAVDYYLAYNDWNVPVIDNIQFDEQIYAGNNFELAITVSDDWTPLADLNVRMWYSFVSAGALDDVVAPNLVGGTYTTTFIGQDAGETLWFKVVIIDNQSNTVETTVYQTDWIEVPPEEAGAPTGDGDGVALPVTPTRAGTPDIVFILLFAAGALMVAVLGYAVFRRVQVRTRKVETREVITTLGRVGTTKEKIEEKG